MHSGDRGSLLCNIQETGGRRKEGRKEMFYLTTHSTHFIYGYMASGIWLRTILIVRKETRCRHMHHPTDRITHTTAFVTPVVEHWLEREIDQCVHPMKDQSDDPSHYEPPHGLLFPISSKGSLICTIPQTG